MIFYNYSETLSFYLTNNTLNVYEKPSLVNRRFSQTVRKPKFYNLEVNDYKDSSSPPLQG